MTPEEAGFSAEKLQKAEAYFHKTNAAAMFIICHGGVVASWGEVSRRFRCHSIRKSFLSGLYGIYAVEGRINLQATLADLDIDDEKLLTEEEKQPALSIC